jgi:beta-N-acetylhexosaminidase
LGNRLGGKLIVITTCHPYDFLERVSQHINPYFAMSESTLSASKSAIDIPFVNAKPQGTLPVGGFRSDHAIKRGSMVNTDKVWYMWEYIFPTWPIEGSRLQAILSEPSARLYIHNKGFCLAFFVTERVAKIAVFGVLPTSRGQGIGTALIKHTRESMSSECRFISFGTGSVFPRLWPGVPINLPQPDKDFLIHRGLYLFWL